MHGAFNCHIECSSYTTSTWCSMSRIYWTNYWTMHMPSTACQDALTTLSANIYNANCTPITNNPLTICTGQCRQYYDDAVENCNDTVSQVAILCASQVIKCSIMQGVTNFKQLYVCISNSLEFLLNSPWISLRFHNILVWLFYT